MQYDLGPIYNVQPAIGVPVNTPATTPNVFQSNILPPKAPSTMIGAGTKGPDLMSRVHLALQSNTESEINWAIPTLLNFSTARNFELLKSRLDLVYLVCDYLTSHFPLVTTSTSELGDSYECLVKRQKVLEALLIIRNMCLDQRLAASLGHSVEQVVIKGVGLPQLPIYTEMRLLCLEICEHACVYFQSVSTDSELFSNLVKLLDSQDKAVIIASLHSCARICICDSRDQTLNINKHTLTKLVNYLLIDDLELVAAVLEFLEQATTRLSSTADLDFAFDGNAFAFAKHLVRLLSFRMDKEPADFLRLKRRTRRPAPVFPPEIPVEIMTELLAMKEPERATMWIRSSYDTDPDGEVLQVSLWSNYQKLFEPHERDGSGKRMLKAIDFIRTCTTNVRGAQAKVLSPPEGPKKFIIKGLVPREKAVAPSQLSSMATNEPDKSKRPPPVYAANAARVLQNIANLQNGQELISLFASDIVEGLCVNPQAADAIGNLMDTL